MKLKKSAKYLGVFILLCSCLTKISLADEQSDLNSELLKNNPAGSMWYEAGYKIGKRDGYQAGFKDGINEAIKIFRKIYQEKIEEYKQIEAGKMLIKEKRISYPRVFIAPTKDGAKVVVEGCRIIADFDDLLAKIPVYMPNSSTFELFATDFSNSILNSKNENLLSTNNLSNIPLEKTEITNKSISEEKIELGKQNKASSSSDVQGNTKENVTSNIVNEKKEGVFKDDGEKTAEPVVLNVVGKVRVEGEKVLKSMKDVIYLRKAGEKYLEVYFKDEKQMNEFCNTYKGLCLNE